MTGVTPSSAITSKRQVSPTIQSSAHTTRGTIASTIRWAGVNRGLSWLVTFPILQVAENNQVQLNQFGGVGRETAWLFGKRFLAGRKLQAAALWRHSRSL